MRHLKHNLALGLILFGVASFFGFVMAALGGDLERPEIRADLSCEANAATEQYKLTMRRERELALRIVDMRRKGEPEYRVKYATAKGLAEIERDAEKHHNRILDLCRAARGE